MEEEVISNIDFTTEEWSKGEYEGCTFQDCIFTDGNLSHSTFMECTFENCDLSSAKLGNTAFKDVKFKECKMLGMDFSNCNTFLLELYFDSCQLNFSSFYLLNLKGIVFKDCVLDEVDFVETVLSGAKILNSSLKLATFDRTNLEKADLRTATQYTINPDQNQIRKAKFAREGLMGLLVHHDIVIE